MPRPARETHGAPAGNAGGRWAYALAERAGRRAAVGRRPADPARASPPGPGADLAGWLGRSAAGEPAAGPRGGLPAGGFAHGPGVRRAGPPVRPRARLPR